MKFFIDTGDVGEIREAHAMGLVDGVTTNPSLVAKTGASIATSSSRSARWSTVRSAPRCSSTTYDEMMAEAREWHKVHKNVVVKLPLIPDGLKAVRTCAPEGIRTNVTLCFSPNQALLAAKAGASVHLAVHRPDRRHQRDGHGAHREDRHHLQQLRLRDRGAGGVGAQPDARGRRGAPRRRRLHHPVQRHAAARRSTRSPTSGSRSSSRTARRSPGEVGVR